jgi:hypothetical protein
LDEDHLPFGNGLSALRSTTLVRNQKVNVICSNRAAAQRSDLENPGSIMRFYGTAEIHESEEYRDKIRTMLQK